MLLNKIAGKFEAKKDIVNQRKLLITALDVIVKILL